MYEFIDGKTPTIEYEDFDEFCSKANILNLNTTEEAQIELNDFLQKLGSYGVPYIFYFHHYYGHFDPDPESIWAHGFVSDFAFFLPAVPYMLRYAYGINKMVELLEKYPDYGDLCLYKTDTPVAWDWPIKSAYLSAFDTPEGAKDYADKLEKEGYPLLFKYKPSSGETVDIKLEPYLFNEDLFSGFGFMRVASGSSKIGTLGGVPSISPIVPEKNTWRGNIWNFFLDYKKYYKRDKGYAYDPWAGPVGYLSDYNLRPWHDYGVTTQRGTTRQEFYIMNKGVATVIDLLGTNFLNAYRVSSSELGQLSQKLWDDDILTQITRLNTDPIDSIIKIMVMPRQPAVANRNGINFGNKTISYAPAVVHNVASQFQAVDLGTVEITPFYHNYLDYKGYSEAEIYLPYIGWKSLAINDIMGKNVNITYVFDYVSGTCLAKIFANGLLLYTFPGMCGVDLPFNGLRANQLTSGIMQSLGAAGAIVASAGNPLVTTGAIASSAVSLASREVIRGGSISGNMGYFADFGEYIPFILVRSPIVETPSGYNNNIGYLYYDRTQLSTLSGFVKCIEFNIAGIPATQDEQEEINKLLSEGVYV